jgi:hypothetical protein
MVIYYVYEKGTGQFAGSGITFFDDNTYGSTEVVVPEIADEEKNAFWMGDHWEVR